MAITAWNTRTPSIADLQAEVEELRRAFTDLAERGLVTPTQLLVLGYPKAEIIARQALARKENSDG